MGFGKFLGGALLAVGAVVAAPVVLPALGATAIGGAIGGAAAAGAAAVGGAAAAAGTAAAAGAAAVSGAAAAVSTAAAGAATVAATAVTSTAVGGVLVGAATTTAAGIGTAVGTAAGAVGLSSVAAVTGTTAGAAGLGTIATTGIIGVSNGVSGATKFAEAKGIKDRALENYNSEKRIFEKVQTATNNDLETLGKEKLKVWSSFDRFVVMYSKIQNPPLMKGAVGKESILLAADELDNIKAVAIGIKDFVSGGVGSVSAGGLIGMATSGGLMSSITVASTGTAISSLSGAAATNATLAAFGGGSLAAGGAGMAGGAAILSGLTFAPMLMVGGIALNSKAKKTLDAAKSVEQEADEAIEQLKTAEEELKKVQNLSNQILSEIRALNYHYEKLMDLMEAIVDKKVDYMSFSSDEKRLLEKTVLVLKLIKQVSMQNILDSKHENAILEKEVSIVLTNSCKLREENLLA